jgi:hypothetical protein
MPGRQSVAISFFCRCAHATCSMVPLLRTTTCSGPTAVTVLPDTQGPLIRAIRGDPTGNFELIRRGAGGKDMHLNAA